MSDNAQLTGLCDRFRGFYPVVIDVETAGFNAKTDALLEIAAITLKMDEQGWLMPDTTLHFHVEPFVGANLQPEALAFNGIDPNDPDRGAVSEYEALHEIFKVVRKGIKASGCNRAIMVAHNANFDHSFMMAAADAPQRATRSTLSPLLTLLHWPGWHSDKPYCQRLARPLAWTSTAPRRTPRCTTPNALLCCFVKSSTAGNVWEAGRYLPPKRCNRVDA